MITQIPYNNQVKQQTITPLLALSGLHSPISLLYFLLLFIGPNSLLIRAEIQGTEGTPFSQTLCFPAVSGSLLANLPTRCFSISSRLQQIMITGNPLNVNPPDSDQLVALHVAKKYSFRNVPTVLPKHIIQRGQPRTSNCERGSG
jgi:hypothetical protein